MGTNGQRNNQVRNQGPDPKCPGTATMWIVPTSASLFYLSVKSPVLPPTHSHSFLQIQKWVVERHMQSSEGGWIFLNQTCTLLSSQLHSSHPGFKVSLQKLKSLNLLGPPTLSYLLFASLMATISRLSPVSWCGLRVCIQICIRVTLRQGSAQTSVPSST